MGQGRDAYNRIYGDRSVAPDVKPESKPEPVKQEVVPPVEPKKAPRIPRTKKS